MATRDEIQWWINNAWEKRRRYQQTVDDCDKQLARLEPVYQELADIKSDFKKARANTRQVFSEKGSWRGEKYTAFCTAGDMLDNSCGSYYAQLDAAHDALNRKIGDLKATKRELIPLIGTLWAQIEQWKIDIENAVN